MATLRDKIWLWGQIPGGHHNPDFYGLTKIPKENKMTPTEGAILCSNCVADIGLSTVPITLDWLNQLEK